MTATEVTARDLRYDAFISYSRKDRSFAGRLERELRSYHPPKDLAVPQRRLRVFRDKEDLPAANITIRSIAVFRPLTS